MPTTERLAVLGYEPPGSAKIENCLIFQTLSSANQLRTLVLIEGDFLRFTRALDPKHNSSNLLLCSNLEELILYSKSLPPSRINDLIEMAENRASRGAKFSSVTFVNLGGRKQEHKVLKLRKHVTNVEYRVSDTRPAWDDVPVEGGDEIGY